MLENAAVYTVLLGISIVLHFSGSNTQHLAYGLFTPTMGKSIFLLIIHATPAIIDAVDRHHVLPHFPTLEHHQAK